MQLRSESALSELQLELAMALGSSAKLEDVLRTFCEALLRRLDARSAGVYAGGAGKAPRLVLELPVGAGYEPTVSDARLPLSPAEADVTHTREVLDGGQHREGFSLPGFGAVLLDRAGPPLSPAVVGALEPVLERLGRAARACLDHTRMAASLSASETEGSRLRMAALLAAATDAVIVADAWGRVLYWNQGAERLLGYGASQVVGHPLDRIIPERLREAHHRGIARHRETREQRVVGRTVELPALHADGRELPVELSLTRVDDGHEVLFVGVLRDLSGRRRAEEETARELEEERRFTATLVDLGRRWLEETSGFEERATATVAEVLGVARVSLWSLTPTSIVCLDLFEAGSQRHSSGLALEERDYKPYFTALRSAPEIIAPDARTHEATACFRESYLEPLGILSMLDVPLRTFDGETSGVLCMEATERREWRPAEVRFCAEVANLFSRATERLARARVEARHQAILSSVGEAVIACDVDERITLLNPIAESLTGWRQREALGRRLAEVFAPLDETTGGAAASLVREALEDRRTHSRVQPALLVGRDGQRLHIEDSASPIVERGELIGTVVTFRDVSEGAAARRTLEHQYQRLRSLGEAIPDLLFTVSSDGRVRYEQERTSADLLTAPEEIGRQTFHTLFAPDIAARLLGAVGQAIASGEVQTVEYALELPAGTQTFEARLARMNDSEATALVRNVTEQRRLNDELARRNEQQRALVDLSVELARTTTREELFAAIERRVDAILGLDLVSFAERTDEGRLLVRFFGEGAARIEESAPASGIAPDQLRAVLPEGRSMVVEPDLARRTSVWEAISRGVAVTSRDRAVGDFPDWAHVRAGLGHDQFAMLPLVGPEGAFGSINVSFRRPEPPTNDECDWLAQVAATIAAHIATEDARAALRRLNLDLEARVEERTRELHASEERFAKLFRHAPQAMLIVDAQQRVVQSNADAQRLFGYGEQEFGGQPVDALVPESVRAHHRGLMASFSADRSVKMAPNRTVRAVRRDGSQFAADVSLVQIELGGAQHVLVGIADVTARVAAQEAVTRSLQEKVTLLREIHHRVKNNLQIISSLLYLQAERMPSETPRRLLEESVLRVRSMALIHQQLYGVDALDRIDFGEYARTLAESLRGALAPTAELRVDAAAVEVTVETAVPLGLILNELVTNAFKYGVPKREGGAPRAGRRAGPGCDVRVEVVLEGDQMQIAVTDSGDGPAEGFDLARSPSLGLQMVRTLTRQLRGKFTVDVDQGSRFAVSCPRLPEA